MYRGLGRLCLPLCTYNLRIAIIEGGAVGVIVTGGAAWRQEHAYLRASDQCVSLSV